jgi:hypothetical protein
MRETNPSAVFFLLGSYRLASTYTAATTNPLHLFSLRGDEKSRDEPASPESPIRTSASAVTRSTSM